MTPATNEEPRLRRSRRAIPPNTPAELLVWLRQKYPDDDKEQLTAKFCEYVRDYDVLIDAVSNDWVSLHYTKVVGSPKEKPSPSEPPEERRKEAERQGILQGRQILANLVLQMTGKECLKYGGAIAKLGKTLKPDQKAGDVYSREQVLEKLGTT
jgi:hypothetical protein